MWQLKELATSARPRCVPGAIPSLTASPVGAQLCQMVDACSCKLENGTVVSLRSLANADGGYAFKTGGEKETFWYNPCFGFDQGSGCSNVSVCANLQDPADNTVALGYVKPDSVTVINTTTVAFRGELSELDITVIRDRQLSLDITVIRDRRLSSDITVIRDRQLSLDITVIRDRQLSLDITVIRDRQSSLDITIIRDRHLSLDTRGDPKVLGLSQKT
ncbi:hypothetical protein Bbelb_093310 [Branchiostoma belcheri]|nr:hypothetical protein Bbelb_093310 [Branchiostoma belcheri]